MSAFSTVLGSFKRLAAMVCAAAALSAPARAAVLVSNIDVPIRGVTILSQDLWAAQAFNTNGAAYKLDSIEVLLGSLVGRPALVAELHANAGGIPGSLLASIPLAGIGAGAPGSITLAGGSWGLSANTAYWLVLGATGSGSFGWAYAEGNAQMGPGSLGGYSYSSNAGVNWGAVGTDNPYNLRVRVSAVPEVSTSVLLLVGLLGMAWRKLDACKAGPIASAQ